MSTTKEQRPSGSNGGTGRSRWRWLVVLLLACVAFGLLTWKWGGKEESEGELAERTKSEPVGIDRDLPLVSSGEARMEEPDYVPSSVLPEIGDAPTDQEIGASRLFSVLLLPTSEDDASGSDNAALAELLKELRQIGEDYADRYPGDENAYDRERGIRQARYDRLADWLKENPNSRWASALQYEQFSHRYDRGYFEEATEGWRTIWEQWKDAPVKTDAYKVANQSLARLLDTNRSLARTEELRELVGAASGRRMGTSLEGKVFLASEAVWLLEHTGAHNILCGPLALNSIGSYLGNDYTAPILNKITPDYIEVGLPLVEVARFAKSNYGLDPRMVRRTAPDAVVPTPAVVHFSRDHYIAILDHNEERGEYLVEDRAMRFSGWVDEEAIEQQSSGYALLASAEVPPGWSEVGEAEARTVFGRHGAHGTDPCLTRCCSGTCKGMPGYSIHHLPAVLRIEDTPLFCESPKGEDTNFTLSFLDIDPDAPVNSPAYSNTGEGWNVDWVAWVHHVPVPSGGWVIETKLRPPGGGTEIHRKNQVGTPMRHHTSGALLTYTGGTSYSRTWEDGTEEIYATPDAPNSSNRVFLTSRSDAHGNTTTFNYDSQMRLQTVTDALGRVTTLQYDHPTDIYKITSVTDPYNRTAVLDYDVDGKLIEVTDQIGLTSSFAYDSAGILTSMTTPYGTTSFAITGGAINRSVAVTDPNGDVEKVEYIDSTSGPAMPVINEPATSVTVGGETISFDPGNTGMNFRNTFVWSKEAWHDSPDDHTVAEVYHWYTDENYLVVPVLQAHKKPLQDWVWYNYPDSDGVHIDMDDGVLPTKVLRMVAPGVGQLQQYFYGDEDELIKSIDPLGRTTEYVWDSEGEDLLEVRQTTGTTDDLLFEATYNTKHQPLTVKGADGQTYTLTYNAAGQMKTVTNPLNEVTTLNYSSNGYLTSVDGPLAGNSDLTSYGYDGYGRVNSVTSPGGHVITASYDDFDRILQVSYPDGTSVDYGYDRLSLASVTDRMNQTTTYTHDALGQVVTKTDPLQRVLTYEWCRCGAIRKIFDALGRETWWKYDVQDRLVEKVYPDGSSDIYNYNSNNGRLTSYTGRGGRQKMYSYNLDDRLSGISYPTQSGNVPTNGVTFNYDAVYGRLETMVDQFGTTTYAYEPVGSLGGGEIDEIDGPWPNDTIAYYYDALGRIIGNTAGGATLATNRNFDALGRLTSGSNDLGQFTYQFDPSSLQLTDVHYPNGVKVEYSYHGTSGDLRLSGIHNKGAGSSTLSDFGYQYNANGQITSWTRQLSNSTSDQTSWLFDYDPAGQLVSAILQESGATAQANVLKQINYAYDPAGNRTGKFTQTGSKHSSVNVLNQLATAQPSTRFHGELSEAGEVTIAGEEARPLANNQFEAFPDLEPGTHTVDISATDRNGNTRTEAYEVYVPAKLTYEYDAAGNLIKEPKNGRTRTYQWDAENRLVRIQSDEMAVAGTWRTDFGYDGYGRRVTRIESRYDGANWNEEESVVYLWRGTQIYQTRDASGTVVQDTYFENGFIRDGVKHYVTRDHLGSVREVVSESGVVESRYDYSPYGEVEVLEESVGAESPFRYTGHLYHKRSGLHLTLYRAYDARNARWLSADPIGEMGGLNLYGYVGNDPVNAWDPLGLEVDAIFDRSTGKLTMWDLDTREKSRTCAKSGNMNSADEGVPDVGPLPAGDYYIVEHQSPGWWSLIPIDSKPYNDVHEPTGRDQFRFHGPGGTSGCIMSVDDENHKKPSDLLNNTKTSEIPDRTSLGQSLKGAKMKKYGILTVFN